MPDYREMWSHLGLDLKSHDALLSTLGSAYRDIFLSQKDRPEGMKYFDFVMSEVHGLRIKELMDAKAQKVGSSSDRTACLCPRSSF